MTEKIKQLLEELKSKEYKKMRQNIENPWGESFSTLHGFCINFKNFIETEIPIIHKNDDFGFNISVSYKLRSATGNFTPNYYRIISNGFDKIRRDIEDSVAKNTDAEKTEFGKAMIECIDIFLKHCDKYREFAKQQGNKRLYEALCKVPHNAAESFYEACVFLKICIYFLRTGFTNHVGLGRFDQYMYPFFLNDKKIGVSDDELMETLEEFFISINKDTDLYHGIQQGDNGQSIVLGGINLDGKDMFNELSRMCMNASIELNLIDPKINLRVGKHTPDEIFEFGTQLTKKGLGFPQYCNDDVVIPGLIKLGYDKEDAVNYVVAACWEYIIPNCGGDIPNINVLDFPNVVNEAIVSNLEDCESFDKLMQCVETAIKNDCDRMVNWAIEELPDRLRNAVPVQSIFFDGCIESLTAFNRGGTKYYNYGAHGAGIANAADALAAVKDNVFDRKIISKKDLIKALENNFEGFEEIRDILKNSPKMGNNDEYVDDIACEIMGYYAQNLNNRPNGYGGIWRAGTGSAMEYIWKGSKCPATADGRLSGKAYSSSFSPSLDVKTAGVLSVIQSFTKFDLSNIINGGPLTLEIHDTLFRNDEGIKKLAMLVKTFVMLGGHQLQLNSVNGEKLRDAQKHPEKYPDLIVRVWGWSGFFNELDIEYQNHIINRAEYLC